MNTSLSNSVDAFYLVTDLESEDFHKKMDTGIFEYYKTKLSALFDGSKPLKSLLYWTLKNY